MAPQPTNAPVPSDDGASHDAAVDAWHEAAESAEITPATPLRALAEVFDDFGGVQPQEPTAPRSVAQPSGRIDGVGLEGDEAEEFLAICAAAARSERRDWLPMVVVAVLVGLFIVGYSGVLQSAWQQVREHEIERRMSRPRAGKSWTEHTGATAADLGLQPAPRGAKRRRNPFVLGW